MPTLNARPTPLDNRHPILRGGAVAALPSEVDLRAFCPPVGNQLTYGSCTAWATKGLAESLQLIQGKPLTLLSADFPWALERELEGTFPQNVGAMPGDTMLIGHTEGFCTESEMPYATTPITFLPNPAQRAAALAYRFGAYWRMVQEAGTTPEEILAPLMARLAAGFTTTTGFQVYDNFFSIGANGLAPMPGSSAIDGGHDTLCCGYSHNVPGAPAGSLWFLHENQWSDTFGMNGYFWLPAAFMVEPTLVSDMWTAQPVSANDPNVPIGKVVGVNWAGQPLAQGGVIVTGRTWVELIEVATADAKRATYYPDATPPFVGVS
ncbi:MAG: C1 family peptidase [Acidobacteriaceae bacterium]